MISSLRITLAIAAVALLGLAYYAWRDSVRDSVYSEIREQNNAAKNNADSFDQGRRTCVDSGGVFDFKTGRCFGSH